MGGIGAGPFLFYVLLSLNVHMGMLMQSKLELCVCAFRSIARPSSGVLGAISEGKSVLNTSVFDDFQKKHQK